LSLGITLQDKLGIQPTYEELKLLEGVCGLPEPEGIQPTYEELKPIAATQDAKMMHKYPAYL